MEETMYCCFCGKILSREFFFCPYCGSASRDTPHEKDADRVVQSTLDRIKRVEQSLTYLEIEIDDFLRAKVS